MALCIPVREVDIYNLQNQTEYSVTPVAPNVSEYETNGSSGSYVYQYPGISVEDILYTYVMTTVCAFGVLGNVLNILVMSRKAITSCMERMEKSAHYGLMALAFSDLGVSLTILPHAWVDGVIYDSFGFSLYYTISKPALIDIFITSSTWLTVSMATSRYLAICHPFRARLFIGATVTKISIFAVFLFSVLFNLPKFWTYSVGSIPCEGDWTAYFTRPGYLPSHQTLEKAHMLVFFITGIFIPIFALVYCNARLIKELHKSARMRQRYIQPSSGTRTRQNHVTLLLVIIVLMHILLVLPCEILRFLKFMVLLDSSHTHAFSLAIAVANTMQAVNFSFNFCLYCAMNVSFRHELRKLCCCCCADTRHRPRRGSRMSLTMATTVINHSHQMVTTSLREENGLWLISLSPGIYSSYFKNTHFN